MKGLIVILAIAMISLNSLSAGAVIPVVPFSPKACRFIAERWEERLRAHNNSIKLARKMNCDENAKEREQEIVNTMLEAVKGITDDAGKFANLCAAFSNNAVKHSFTIIPVLTATLNFGGWHLSHNSDGHTKGIVQA